jgi:hypothetical protein
MKPMFRSCPWTGAVAQGLVLGLLVVGAGLGALGCSASALPDSVSSKPAAPVEMTLSARALDASTWVVTVVATPTVDLDALTLRLPGGRETVAPARAGEARRLTVRIGGPARGGPARNEHGGEQRGGEQRGAELGPGFDVIAVAETVRGAARRSDARVLRLGTPATTRVAPPRTVRWPGVGPVAEVRP